MLKFLRNPLRALMGSIKGAVNIASRLRIPVADLAVRLGRGLTEVGATVKASELRRQVAAENEILRANEAAGQIPAHIPRPDAMIPAALTKLRRNYSYTVRHQYIDSLTGNMSERFTTVSSDHILADVEAIAESEGIFLPDYGIERSQLVSSEVTSVVKAGPLGRL